MQLFHSVFAEEKNNQKKEENRMHYTFTPKGVCSMKIDFDIDGDVVSNISFIGGCNGNLKAISKILDGWTVDQIENKIKGNTCGLRRTSCADQLAIAVRQAYNETQAAI